MVNLLTALTGASIEHNNSPIDDNAWDENLSTYYGVSIQQSGGGSKSNTIYSGHTFSGTYTIHEIVTKIYIHQWSSSGASNNSSSASASVEIYRSGAWETVSGMTISVSGGGDSNSSDTLEVTLSGTDLSLTGVERIRASVYVYAHQDGDGGGQGADGKIYELQAWGDIGGGYGVLI